MNEGIPTLPNPGDEEDKSKKEEKVQNGLESNESMELTLEEKYKVVGRKDSILDLRGVHLSINYLEILLKDIVIKDKSDLEAVADAVEAKFAEIKRKNKNEVKDETPITEIGGKNKSEVEISSGEKIKEKKLKVEEHIKQFGFDHPKSADMLKTWVLESEQWVEAENTTRASIIHNLRVMDLVRVGGNMELATEMALDAYRMATKEEQWDIVDDILLEFPLFGQETDLS